MNLDEDALIAAVELVGRTGAKGFQIGYLNDEPPQRWYAYAQYQGTRITADEHRGPVEAAEALARRLLEGGKCTRCGGVIALSGTGAMVYPEATLTDGTRWTATDAAAAGQCRWARMGNHWAAGCQRTDRTSTARSGGQ